MISIDELTSNWSIEQIEEICTFNPKHDRKLSDDVEISFVPMNIIEQQTGTIKKHDSQLLGEVRKGYTHFADGDIIFAKITPCMENGKSAVARNLINGLACGSTEFHVLRSDNGVLPDYLLNFLRQASYLRIAAGEMTGVVGQRRLPKEFLLTTKIPLPPLNEQRRIVAKIEALSARSQRVKEALEEIPQLLDQFRQSVLLAAFRGDLTADWQEANLDVEPNSTEDIPLLLFAPPIVIGEVETHTPLGWSWVPLIDVATLESGHTPRKSVPEYWEGGNVPWICLQDIRAAHGKIIYETLYMPTMLGIENSSARLLPEGTVCFSRDISVGFVTIMGRSMATTQHFANWICGSKLFNKYLMYAFMAASSSLIQLGEGTTVRTIYMPALKRMQILLPPIEEQKEIVHQIESLYKAVDIIKQQYQEIKANLDQLDQSILAKAFCGKLVPQDPNDEPASILLERIRAEREKLNSKTAKKSPNKTGGDRSTKAQLQDAEPVQLELGLE